MTKQTEYTKTNTFLDRYIIKNLNKNYKNNRILHLLSSSKRWKKFIKSIERKNGIVKKLETVKWLINRDDLFPLLQQSTLKAPHKYMEPLNVGPKTIPKFILEAVELTVMLPTGSPFMNKFIKTIAKEPGLYHKILEKTDKDTRLSIALESMLVVSHIPYLMLQEPRRYLVVDNYIWFYYSEMIKQFLISIKKEIKEDIKFQKNMLQETKPLNIDYETYTQHLTLSEYLVLYKDLGYSTRAELSKLLGLGMRVLDRVFRGTKHAEDIKRGRPTKN